MALVAVNLVDGIESSLLIGVLPLLQAEWGFSDTLAGALPTAAAMTGLLMIIPAGYLADHFERTRLLAYVVGSWALLTVASSLATGFWVFFLIRAVLGSANSLDNPSASSLVTDFYPPGSRSRVFAFQRTSWTVGSSLGVAMGGVLGETFGWRVPFLVMVGPGLLVAWWCWNIAEPTRGGMEPGEMNGARDIVGEPEVKHHVRQRRLHGLGSDLAALWRIPTLRAIYTGAAVAYLGFNGIAYWLPTFWEREFDLGEGKAAALTGVIGLVAAIGGSVLGGIFGDRWAARHANARVVVAGGGLVLGGVFVVGGMASPALAMQAALLLVGAALIVSAAPNFAAIIADVLPPSRRGIGYAAFTFVIVSGGALGPLVIGGLSDLVGSLQGAFVVGLVPVAPGGLIVLRAARLHASADSAARAGRVP